MDPEERLERIEALLHGMAKRGNQMEARSIKEFARVNARMDRFDKQLQAARKLVEAGIKLVSRLGSKVRELRLEVRETSREVREVSRIQKAMLRPHSNGRNGKKHG